MKTPNAGFEEIEHTADWALRIWAPDLAGLFVQAAIGMNVLAEVQLQDGERERRVFEHQAPDPEMMLVAFLSEILYWGEREELGFDRFALSIDGQNLKAELEGAAFLSRKKEIKAVTYHNMKVCQGDLGFEVEIVFDV